MDSGSVAVSTADATPRSDTNTEEGAHGQNAADGGSAGPGQSAPSDPEEDRHIAAVQEQIVRNSRAKARAMRDPLSAVGGTSAVKTSRRRLQGAQALARQQRRQ